MKKFPLLTVFILLAILYSAWTPAAAASGQAETATAGSGVTLTISNPLPKATVVTLRGSDDYTFTVPANQTVTKTIEQGKYRYKYNGCLDKKASGILTYKDGKYELDIPACKTVKVRIINPYAADFTSTMNGWVNYNINVPAGTIKIFDVIAGRYLLSYTCSNGYSWSGKVKLSRNVTWAMCTN
jgi:hypothetical protein